jgi:imidazolonepropionase-like amidohydrolase
MCALAAVFVGATTAQHANPTYAPTAGANVGHPDILIKNATILTATHGRIPNGSVLVRNGKIAQVGGNIAAPAGATVIDAGGKYLTPGIIDSHSHMALDGDVNEATSPVVPHMIMLDAFDDTDRMIYRALAGGVTSALLHGSAGMIGGQAVAIKTKFGLERGQMLFPGAPQSIKFASGENPFFHACQFPRPVYKLSGLPPTGGRIYGFG